MKLNAAIVGLVMAGVLSGCGNQPKETVQDGDNKGSPKTQPKGSQKDSHKAAGQSASKKKTQAAAKKKPDTGTKKAVKKKAPNALLRLVPANTAAIALVRPAQVTAHPFFVLFPSDALDEMFGMDLKQIEGIKQVMGIAPAIKALGREGPPFALLLEFASEEAAMPFRVDIEKGTREQVAGRVAFSSETEPGSLASVVTNQIVVMGARKVVEQVLATQVNQDSKKGPRVLQHLRLLDDDADLVAVVNLRAMRPVVDPQLASFKRNLPTQHQSLLDPASQVGLVGLRVNISSPTIATLSLTTTDEAASPVVAGSVQKGLELGKSWYQDLETVMRKRVPKAMAPLFDITSATVAGIRSKTYQKQVQVIVSKPKDFDTLPILLKPLVEAARAAARQEQRVKRLEEIGFGLQVYHDANRKLPGNITDKVGQPLLSWRVTMLRYIGQKELYARFRLDEPWDSEHNKKLLRFMPRIYGKSRVGATDVQSFNGARPRTLRQVEDGTDRTLFAVIVDDNHRVNWTEPVDLPPKAADLIKAVEKSEGHQILGVTYGGKIRPLEKKIDPKILERWIDHNDGKSIPGR